ncbi:glycosyltransferase family 2 protein [Enterocloster clostridioformis]|uniref:glycosyltransferase family 2 protein n=1 Tax=Enterocloster clostridioformis TaxID=1531 RepID=UPI00325B0FFB
MKKCVDIVVTYNRKELLRENISALIKQSYRDHDILVIDNASTDGTQKMVEELNNPFIRCYNTGKNLGGAGGFSYGLKIAAEGNYRYAWIMDDDSIPENSALESLINKSDALKDEFSFLASLVYWIDGNIFPMNFPRCDYKVVDKTPHMFVNKFRLLPITGGSFVGCFVNLQVVRKVGLPIADFFIYGDDLEYTHRLKKEKPCYLDMDSSILHKAPSNKGADIATAGVDRIPRFFYQSRNGMYVARKDKKVLLRFAEVGRRTLRILKEAPDYKGKRIWMLAKGTICGLVYNPQIEYPNSHRV